MPKLKVCAYIFATLISLPGFTHASEENSFSVNDYLNEILSLQANFKQTIFSPTNDVIDYSEGSFLLKKLLNHK